MNLIFVVLKQLKSARNSILDRKPVTPEWRLFTPEGNFAVRCPPNVFSDAKRTYQRIARFMAWKMTLGFVHTVEINLSDKLDPHKRTLFSVAVSRRERFAAVHWLERVEGTAGRWRMRFVWLDAEQVDDYYLNLLPSGSYEFSQDEISRLIYTFAPGGPIPTELLGCADNADLLDEEE